MSFSSPVSTRCDKLCIRLSTRMQMIGRVPGLRETSPQRRRSSWHWGRLQRCHLLWSHRGSHSMRSLGSTLGQPRLKASPLRPTGNVVYGACGLTPAQQAQTQYAAGIVFASRIRYITRQALSQSIRMNHKRVFLHSTGERDYFEDRYRLQPDFQPGPAAAAAGADMAEVSERPADSQSREAQDPAAGQPLRCSYAGVFDGHSAADAADAARERLHVLLAGELGACQR